MASLRRVNKAPHTKKHQGGRIGTDKPHTMKAHGVGKRDSMPAHGGKKAC